MSLAPHVNPGDGSDVTSWVNLDGGLAGRYDAFGRRRANAQTTAPAKAAGAAAGASPTIALSASSSDEHGLVTVTAGASGTTTGTLVTITFNEAYATTPAAVVVSQNDSVGALGLYASATTTALTIGCHTGPTATDVYKISYIVVGGA